MTSRKYDVLIIGGYGHVGLPLGIALAERGLSVGLYDIDRSRDEIIAAGKMPFLEYGAEPILAAVIGKTLHIEKSLDAVRNSKSVIVTIGTPVDEYLNPKLLPILKMAEALLPYLFDHHHVVLRSTVYPGTTERVANFFKSRDINVDLAFCPERIAQGYAIQELSKLPQIIAGTTTAAVEKSIALFRALGCDTVTTPLLEAELAKLFANSWRYIQFAVANQFYMIAAENGADFDTVHYAMTYRYGRAADFPKPGFAAGPCLLKDTMQLSAFYKNHFMVGHAAMLINEGLPSFIVSSLERELDLKDHVVGIMGMAFKGNIDDIRDSLSYKLGKLLRFTGAEVLYTDEFVEDATFSSKEELVARSSIIIVGAPHSAYADVIIPPHVRVVDLWGILNKRENQYGNANQRIPTGVLVAAADGKA